jgi:signal transduction histidine kinase
MKSLRAVIPHWGFLHLFHICVLCRDSRLAVSSGNMSHSRKRAHLEHGSTVVTMALFAPFVLVLSLVLYTLQSERSRRVTESLVMRDYGVVAVAELKRSLSAVLHTQVERLFQPLLHRASNNALAAHVGSRIDPALIAQHAAKAESLLFKPSSAEVFRYELPSGAVTGAGSHLADAPRILARLRESAGAEGDPHRILTDTANGALLTLALYVVRDTSTETSVVYGARIPAIAIGTVVEQVLAGHRIVPSAIVRPPHTAEHLRVSVFTIDGAPLWSNATQLDTAAGTDTLPLHLDQMLLRVEAGPAIAKALRIGRPSSLYLPVLAALLMLSGTLAIVALMQIRRAREMARLRTRFVANVSHELRTPLTQISMFAEMLALGRDRNREEQHRYARVIHREVIRLSNLVESVLTFSRAQEGNTAIRRERRNVADDVRDAVEFFELVAKGSDVKLEVQTSGELWAQVDPSALRQVMLNLLDNAVKYGPRGQTVRVTACQSGQYIQLSVSDEGPGVPREERERVFHPYVRIDRPDQPRVAGTGIGLAVVRELVMAHDGAVHIVDSECGATVVVTIPADQDAPCCAQAKDARAESTGAVLSS